MVIGGVIRVLKLVLKVVGLRIFLVDLVVLITLFLFSIILLSVAICVSRASYLVVAVDEGGTVIHGGGSLPYTGALPASVLLSVTNLLGPARVCPEVIALVNVKDVVVFLRGVEPACFGNATFYQLVEEHGGVFVGIRLSRILGVGVNETIVLKSLHSSRSAVVRIADIVSGNDVLESEIVADIRLARWLRGFTDQISILRLINISAYEVELLKNVTPVARGRGLIPSLLLTLFTRVGTRSRDGGQTMLLDYSEAAEIAKSTSLVSIAVILLLSACALTLLPTASLKGVSNFLKILAVLGLGEEKVWRVIAFLKMLTFVLSFLSSFVIFIILSKSGLLTVPFLHHYWTPRIPMVDVIAYFSASVILYICGVVHAKRIMSWVEEPTEQLLF